MWSWQKYFCTAEMSAAPTHTRATFATSQVSSLCFRVALRNERPSTNLHQDWVTAALAVRKCWCLAVAYLHQFMLPKYTMPPALSRALKETHSLQAPKKISFKVVLHCQVTFPLRTPKWLFSLKTKPQGSCPRLVEYFATVSLTKMYNCLIASIFRFFTVTWIWAIWDFSTKHHWLTLSVYLYCTVNFQNRPCKLRETRVVAISMCPQLSLSSPLFFRCQEHKLGNSNIKLFFLLCCTVDLSHEAYHSMTKTPFQPTATSLIYFSSGSYSFSLKYMPLGWIKHRKFNCLNIFYGKK